jgi:hypothetical protein
MGGQQIAVGDQMSIQRLIFLGQGLSLGEALKLWSVAPSEMGRVINRRPVCLLELLGLQLGLASALESSIRRNGCSKRCA